MAAKNFMLNKRFLSAGAICAQKTLLFTTLGGRIIVHMFLSSIDIIPGAEECTSFLKRGGAHSFEGLKVSAVSSLVGPL